MKYRSFLFALLAMALLVACGGADDGADSSAASGEITVENAWGRTSPMVADNGAFYLTITNGTDTDDELLSAAVDVCNTVELHEMYMMENDVMGMRQVPGGTIPVPAGETVELKVGGLHVMCIGKTADFQAGDTYDITLDFAEAGEMVVTADIRDSAEMPMDMEGMDMEGEGMNMEEGGMGGDG